MYPGKHVELRKDQPAFIMATSGLAVTYAELDARANQLAHLLRSLGLRHRDHYSVFMENNDRYLEACSAGERSGLYLTCINSHLTAPELAYIVNNSQSKVLITSRQLLEVAKEAAKDCPNLIGWLAVDAGDGDAPFADYVDAISSFPTTTIDDECRGVVMLYSSGTTGRPKGISRPLDVAIHPSDPSPAYDFMTMLWGLREGATYLSPAPLYHSAPLSAAAMAIRSGNTVIIMENFDPEEFLRLVEEHHVTHSQMVPTMFSRILKLPRDVRLRYDVSTLESVSHGAAPCPVQVKREMIEWWGPIFSEYYGATEGMGFTMCQSDEWLSHPGTVGKVILGDLRVLNDEMEPTPLGEPGTLWFKTAMDFEYFNDPEKTKESTSPDGELVTVGDVGYLDEEGYLYLTDRATFMIISGGVNIYPQEAENLLIVHEKVADAAVFGVPNEDLGEEVKAVVQLMPGIEASPDLGRELIEYCRAYLSHVKCPRTIDFIDELPRLPTGKLYKRILKDQYWGKHDSRIV